MLVQENQRVSEGELLMKFDREAIEQAGFELTTPVIITNLNAFSSVNSIASKHVLFREPLLVLTR